MATAGTLRSESAGSRGLVSAPGLPSSFSPSVFPPSLFSLLRQRCCGSGASRCPGLNPEALQPAGRMWGILTPASSSWEGSDGPVPHLGK